MRSAARLDGGSRSLGRLASGDEARGFEGGGRTDTQSCTSSETLGFASKLIVFREEGLVVIIIMGPLGKEVGEGLSDVSNACDSR